jgi:hypothetical protein
MYIRNHADRTLRTFKGLVVRGMHRMRLMREKMELIEKTWRGIPRLDQKRLLSCSHADGLHTIRPKKPGVPLIKISLLSLKALS